MPDPTKVGELYDRYTALGGDSLGENLHFGYWEKGGESVSLEDAADHLTDIMAGRLELRPGARVLDLGCGVGGPGTRLAAVHGADVTGISVSREQIERADRRAADLGLADRARFEVRDAMELPFAPDSFDAVFALESIIHMPDRGEVLRQVARVLRPGGRIVLTDFWERSAIPAPGRQAVDRYLDDFMMTSVDPGEWVTISRAAGLWIQEISDITDQTLRPSFVELSARLRAAGSELSKAHGAEQVDTFDPGDLIDVPEFGYLLVVARKPPNV